ncbi:MAG: penicillin-binding protein 2, partial [Burkholderiales bacterium]
MVEVRNVQRDLAQFRRRLAIAFGVSALFFVTLFARLVYLQVVRYDDFHAQAEDNRVALLPVPPTRGLVFDRNGQLVVENVAGYTLELVPERVDDLERTVAALGELVEITPREHRRFRRLLAESGRRDPVPLKTRLTDVEAARLAAYRFDFPGVEVRARLFRNYPFGATAAHVLGYLGRISPEDLRRLEAAELAPLYAGSTHIGKIVVEKSYERTLHGRPGFEEVEVTASGRTVRTLSRTPA